MQGTGSDNGFLVQSPRLSAMSKALGEELVSGISSRTRWNTFSFLQVTSVRGANVFMSSLFLGGIQNKLLSYSFVVHTLVLLDFFHAQRLINSLLFWRPCWLWGRVEFWITLMHHGTVCIASIVSRSESGSHKIVHDRPGLRPIARTEHGRSKRS